MKKSAYSLVLSDFVIQEIDKLAYTMNTSRSNLINQILADYVSYETPEKRVQEIFTQIEQMLTGMQEFQLLMKPSDTMITLRSALAYKYNPTIKYSVELNRGTGPEIGELRVSLRSQSANLLLYFMQFYKLWAKIENAYIGPVDYQMDDAKFIRKLHLRQIENAHAKDIGIGQTISNYIKAMDNAIKLFFSNLDNPAHAANEVEKQYNRYLSAQRQII